MIKTVVSTDVTDRPSSEHAPVELWELMGRPLLSYVLDLSEAFSEEPATVLAGAERDQFQEAFPNRTVDWGRSGESPVEVLRKVAADSDPDQLLVLRGNMPLVRARHLEELIHHHERTEASMTILSGSGDRNEFPCRVKTEDGEVQAVDRREADAGETAGDGRDRFASPVALVEREELEAVFDQRQMEEQQLSARFFLNLSRAFLDRGNRVELYMGHASDESTQVTSAGELSEATGILRKRVISLLLEQGVKVLSPDQTYIEPDVEIGEGTVIEPFVVIRNGVTIGSDCHLGPFCQIREGTHLEDQAEIGNYVETKNSRVGRKTKAKHLSYLGDATIGEQVNIGAGTITANYDGSEKHRTIIEDYASTGSNTVLIAPVTMKERSKTGAGAVVCRGDDVEAGTTVVGVPAKCVDDS